MCTCKNAQIELRTRTNDSCVSNQARHTVIYTDPPTHLFHPPNPTHPPTPTHTLIYIYSRVYIYDCGVATRSQPAACQPINVDKRAAHTRADSRSATNQPNSPVAWIAWVLTKVAVSNVPIFVRFACDDWLPADVTHQRTAPACHLVAPLRLCETGAF